MAATSPVEQPELHAGTVTALESQQHDPERVSVYIDGRYAFGLAWDLAVQTGLRKGQHLTERQQAELLDEEQRLRARRAALDYIAYRARTAEEVRRKLAHKGFPEAAVDAALERMVELGYLDDEAYARAFVRSKLAGRGYGPERIRADLRRRGVAPLVVEAALAELAEPEDLLETALRQGRQRWQRLASEPDLAKRRKKLSDFLARRGYSYDLIREVIEVLGREG